MSDLTKMLPHEIVTELDRAMKPVVVDQYLIYWLDVVGRVGLNMERSPRGFESALALIIARMVVAERTLDDLARSVGGTRGNLIASSNRNLQKP